MLANEAYKIFLSKVKHVNVIKCMEYKSLFVFQYAPKMLDKSKDPTRLHDTLVSVNKKTKKVKIFQPYDISLEEYRDGREVFTYESR